MTSSHFLTGCVLVVSLTACGDSNSSPTIPTPPPAPPTPTVTSITIMGLDAVRTGFVADYTLTASMSDGTTQTVAPNLASWSTSNPQVAAVDANGRFTAVTHGTVNLAAAYQGRNAAKGVYSVHNYGGNWTGTYTLTACDQSGVFATVRWCQELGGVGALLPFSLGLTQSGNNRDQIAGTMSLGSLEGNVSGAVQSDARLVIGGSYVVTSSGVTFRIEIGGFEARPSGTSMTGQWAQNLTAVGITGNAYQQSRIATATHTTQQALPAAAPSPYELTLEQTLGMIKTWR